MANLPEYEEAHLVVAAIRVLEATLHRPPDEAEIGSLLGWPPERAGVITRALVNLGALRVIEHAFEHRLEISNHLKLEDLPRDSRGAEFVSEMEEHARQSEERNERLARMFETGEAEKERANKLRGLDQAFGEFRKARPKDPFEKS